MVKKRLFKYTSVLMCVVLSAASLVACGTNSASNAGTDKATVSEMAAGNTEETINSAISTELAIDATNKLDSNSRKETVYIFSDATGKKEHITVNEKVTDEKGEETLTKTTSNAEEPVTIKVTYKLDGKEISAKDLAGKSGKVTIRFDYKNNVTKSITIGGKNQIAYVPFTMITGMMLPTDQFSNVEITNGKLTKVGDKVVAVGMTMPGLKETMNLKLGNEQIDVNIPEYVEVTADVKNFSLDMTMSVATTNLLSNIDVEDITIDDLKKQVKDLEDAANKLTDGTAALQEGTQQLENALPALIEGVSQLDEGAASLKSGIYAYANGASEINTGINQVSAGLDELNSKVTAGNLEANVAALANGAAALNNGTQQLKSTLVTNMTSYSSSYATAYNGGYQILTAVGAQAGLSGNAQSALSSTVTNMSLSDSDENKAAAKAADESLIMTSKLISVYSMLPASYQSQAVSVVVGLNQASTAYFAMAGSYQSLNGQGFFDGMASLAGGLSQVNAAMPSLCSGIAQLQAGASKLKTGSDTLVSNNDTLTGGVSKLAAGTSALNNSTGTLANGVTQLNAGAVTLKDGMLQFNAQAIQPITTLVNGDADTAVNTLKEVIKIGQNYDTFLGKHDGKKNSVTFIYKTEGIPSED